MQVGARKAALVAGGLTAVCVAAVFCVRTVPDRVISLLGGPDTMERWGGVRLKYEPPGGGPVELLEFPGVGVDRVSVKSLTDVLVAGGLAMKLAREDNWAVELANATELVIRDERDADEHDPRARLEPDYWVPEDGIAHRTFFLQASSRKPIELAIADAQRRGVTLPPNTEIAYEEVDARYREKPSVRAYLLEREALIDGTMIDRAVGSFDPNTGLPIVLLDFTSEGGDRFCELTRRISGQKLATVLGGAVRSAPIINGPICGGRASINMGGSDPDRQLAERDMIVEVLSHGAMPPGGTIRDMMTFHPHAAVLQTMLARLLLGLLAGLVAALITWFVVGRARPSIATRPAFTGAFPWRRALITGLAPLALIAGKRVMIPGVDDIELAHVMRVGDLEFSSVIALGLAPIMVAFFLVELVALAVPALRWRRHDPAGRIGLGKVTAIVAIVLALVHGYLVAGYLESASAHGSYFIDMPGMKFRLIAMISLVSGSLLLAVIAGVISEHGLGNGYGVVIAAGIALDLIPDLDVVAIRELALGVVTFAAMTTAAMFVLRWRIVEGRQPALRVPTSGLSPLADSGAFISLIFSITGLAANATMFDLLIWSAVLTGWKVKLAIVALTIPLWAWLFARPAVVERLALQAGMDRVTRATWLRAAAVSALLIGGCMVIGLASPLDARLYANPISALVVAAVVLDVIADANARRSALGVAAVLHQPQYLGVVEDALDTARLPYHLHASQLRTLFAFFGPWAPIHVLVPAERAIEARLLLEEILRGSSAVVPEARAR